MTFLRREALGRGRAAEGSGDHGWETVEGKGSNAAREVMS